MSLMIELSAELKRRIQHDMEPLGKWNEKLWAKVKFGDFYGKGPANLETIHRVVGETVDNVLAPSDLQMTVDSWVALQGEVDATDTAETALPDMDDSSLVTEGRTNGRPELIGEAMGLNAELDKPKNGNVKT